MKLLVVLDCTSNLSFHFEKAFHFEAKHPTIRPKVAHSSHLIVSDFHVKYSHSGLDCTLATSCQRYWVIGATATVRRRNLCNQFCLKTTKPVKQLIEGISNFCLKLGFSRIAVVAVEYVGPASGSSGICSLQRSIKFL